MPGLAMMLLPLIPGMIDGILKVVDTIRNHDQTPDALKMQLEGISADLKAINARVQAVELPTPGSGR